MITSMTGFGKAVKSINGYVLEIEAKSLNSRYLEVILKLPGNNQEWEYDLREFVKTKVTRGKLYINITIKPEGSNQSSLFYNESKISEILAILKKVNEQNGLGSEVSLEHLLTFKDLFAPDLEELDDSHFEALRETLDEALINLLEMRKKEGSELAKDLISRIGKIEELVGKIESLIKGSVNEHFEKVKERAAELVKDLTEYDDRLEFELALLTERSDITEECVRLKSHLKFFEKSVQDGKDAGRKLNFICQEMHREANTISSKSLSTDITHHSVMIREEVERIREQVQNIE